MDNPLPRHAANPTQQNIDAIAKLEHEAPWSKDHHGAI